MFEQFPKIRPELPAAYKAIYAAQYKENRDGASTASGLAQKLESWMHRRVAADVLSGPAKSTLEIGAGTLNQMAYEPLAEPYDIVEPFPELFEQSPLRERVRIVYDDISEIPSGEKYQRITSIAAFEHICNLPEVLARAGLLLADGGELRCGIPSEGTVLWRLGYTMTTGLEFRRRHGLDYEVLMRHEHVNTAAEIEDVLRFFFDRVEIKIFGVARSLSLYQFLRCRAPHLARCDEYLRGLA
ncbi:MAG: hypothetical protein WKF34_02755 [Pyrinomonadaceae bacterium]